MGLSIKNEEVESLVRRYANAQGIGVTEAIARAVQIAEQTERVEKTEFARRQAMERLLKIGGQGWASDSPWTRDELHTR